MRRLVIILAITFALLAVGASPAFGYAVPPEPGAYVFPFSGDWTEVTATGAEIEHFWTQDPSDPENWLMPDPIPAGMDIWMAFTWVAPGRGGVLTVPRTILTTFDIYVVLSEDPFELGDQVFGKTYAQGRAYWSSLYLYDGSHGEVLPFNPRIGARIYARDWWVPVPPLDPGNYLIAARQKFVHTVNDLSGGAFEGQHTPAKTMRGEYPPADELPGASPLRIQ